MLRRSSRIEWQSQPRSPASSPSCRRARGSSSSGLEVSWSASRWVGSSGRFAVTCMTRKPLPGWKFMTVVGWAGLRGGDSLILAAAIPIVTAAGAPFPGRDAIVAITYGVIIVTLVGQGFALAPLLRWLGVRETGEEERREETEARLRTAEVALARLEELSKEPWVHSYALSDTRDHYRHRARRLQSRADGTVDGVVEAKAAAHRRLTRELLAVERRELLRLRDSGAINDAVMRRVQRDLDLEELLLEDQDH